MAQEPQSWEPPGRTWALSAAEESLSGTHWPVLQLGKQASRWGSFPEVPPRAARAGVLFQPRHLRGHLGGGQCALSCSWSWQEGLYPCPPNSAVRSEPGLATVSELGPSPGGLQSGQAGPGPASGVKALARAAGVSAGGQFLSSPRPRRIHPACICPQWKTPLGRVLPPTVSGLTGPGRALRLGRGSCPSLPPSRAPTALCLAASGPWPRGNSWVCVHTLVPSAGRGKPFYLVLDGGGGPRPPDAPARGCLLGVLAGGREPGPTGSARVGPPGSSGWLAGDCFRVDTEGVSGRTNRAAVSWDRGWPGVGRSAPRAAGTRGAETGNAFHS